MTGSFTLYPQRFGFTLVELVVTLALTGIVATVAWRNIAGPVVAFNDQARRSQLVDTAVGALDRISRELRLALPNSVRVTGTTAVEFLRTNAGGRYREQAGSGGAGSPLSFTASSGTFDVLGGFPAASTIVGGASGRASCMSGVSDCLVIFNTGQSGANAFAGDNVAGIVSASTTSVQFTRSDAGSPFPFRSPEQHFFIVDTPVSLICDATSGELRRYADYAITSSQNVPPGTQGTLLANHVISCGFAYVPGTHSRAGMVNVSLTIAEAGEAVTLLQQVRIPNVP